MAIKIHKREETEKQVLEPEVLNAGGNSDNNAADAPKVSISGLEDDSFLLRSNNAMAWMMENRRMIGFVVGLLVIVSLGYIFFNHQAEKAAIDKSSFMTSAFETYTAMTQAQADELEKQREAYLKQQGIAAESDDILRVTYTVRDDQTRFAMIERHLKESVQKVPGETVEPTAELMLAGTQARIRDAAEAKNAYDKAAASTSPSIRFFAMLGQAEMLIGQQKYDEALQMLDNIAAANVSFSAYTALEKGRIYEIKGETDKAIATYDHVIRDFSNPGDEQKALARLRILTPDWANHMKDKLAPVVPAAPVAPAAL
ncbi:MAG: tetratricopeptide repeat protein [Proteobacteria bacterium]|nr:tetratricopeptide repeat protein [Pseudomonadota bacterium]